MPALPGSTAEQHCSCRHYQHELFGHQRIIGQVDIGGLPFDAVAETIELLATEVAPVVRRLVKVNCGKCSTSKKSSDRRCLSRGGLLVSTLAAPIVTLTSALLRSMSAPVPVRLPWTSVKRPRTVTLVRNIKRMRALNSTREAVGSISQVVLVAAAAGFLSAGIVIGIRLFRLCESYVWWMHSDRRASLPTPHLRIGRAVYHTGYPILEESGFHTDGVDTNLYSIRISLTNDNNWIIINLYPT